MNPGLLDEGGKAAVATVEALKTSPLVLALVVINLLLVGLLAFVVHKNAELRKSQFSAIMDQQKQSMELLRNCTVRPPP